MHFMLIGKILGMLMLVFSLSMLSPVLVSWFFDDQMALYFLLSFGIVFSVGLLLWLIFFRARAELSTRDGFLIVTLLWTVLGLSGAVPFYLLLDTTWSDAIFESISGITTTGATVYSNLQDMPPSLLFYRQQLQWLGGMGVVVLAVAVLPMLGIGGMQLYKAEIPGPMKESKLTPRIAETAKALWYVYLGVTLLCAASYWLAGMSPFEAICHSFSTVSTGGFSTHDDSLGAFGSPAIEWVATCFMFFGGASFALMFSVWRRRSPATFFRDPEFRFYCGLMFLYFVVCAVTLWTQSNYASAPQTLRHAAFHVASLGTGTGLVATEFWLWPSMLPLMLVLTSFISGCAGSTTGGMKIVRSALVLLQSTRELKRLVYPHGVFALRFGKHAVSDTVLQAIWGFIGVYIVLAVVLTLGMISTGMDAVTAFSTVAASLNTLGIGLGDASEGFSLISTSGKWIMCAAMLLGRLEIFTILVLFTPFFWRQ